MQNTITGPEHLRILILAPTGQDAPLIQRVLTDAGISALICHGLRELTDMLRSGAGAVLLAQEALQSKEVEAFIGALQTQPPWSDLPITLLTLCGAGQRAIQKISDQFQKVGNLTVVERPVHTLTLTSVVRVALRSRVHQYEVRDLVERLTASQTELQEKSKTWNSFMMWSLDGN